MLQLTIVLTTHACAAHQRDRSRVESLHHAVQRTYYRTRTDVYGVL
jgi:hypothetical protein